jgi:hypothetical protein
MNRPSHVCTHVCVISVIWYYYSLDTCCGIVFKIMYTIHSLINTVSNEIGLYQAAQEQYKLDTLNKMRQQGKIVKPDITAR